MWSFMAYHGDFRSTAVNGHLQAGRACLKGATNGHAPPQRRELLPLFDPTIKFSRAASRRLLPPPDRIAATIALEMIGPIPGTLISRSQPASWRANRWLCVSKTPIAL
jgi:hypothetical protein